MGKDTIRLRVFVVGCPRSGTTLLQSFLAAHPDIISFPESVFFPDLFGQHEWRLRGRWPDWWRFGLRAWTAESRLRLGLAHRESTWAYPRLAVFLRSIGREDLLESVPRQARLARTLGRRFVGLLDRLAVEAGKSMWLEKTPSHLNYMDRILKLVPSAKFVDIIRDGEDNVASLYDMALRYPETWWRQFADLDVCIDTWNRCAMLAEVFASHPAHLLVRHERLVAEPEAELQRICGFLGLPFSPRMLRDRAKVSNLIITEQETWKQGAAGKLVQPTRQKFMQLLDPRQRDHVKRRLLPRSDSQ